MSGTDAGRPWWADAVIYQVYLRSFQDSDGNGIGDLQGVLDRLDYLIWLGIDAIWLAPFHPSPLLDGGYDVSDFLAVDPRFGDLAMVDRLMSEAHRRGIKVIMDFVPNHTSDQHPWFAESRSSAQNPKRDWYVWQDGKNGGPPNNWGSMLGGPAWTRDAVTGQFYYHAFLPEQPDLNWRNPEVQNAMADVLRFWLGRGIDGVRVDAVPHLVEDALLRDDLPEEIEAGGMPVQGGLRHVYTSNRPENLDCMALLRSVIDGFDDRVLIGEAHLPMPLVMRYHGVTKPGLHAPFNFTLLESDWNIRSVSAAIDQYLNLLPENAWPNWVLGNHDETRVASRIGSEQARVAAMLAFTIGGAPIVYNGDELGLQDIRLGSDDLWNVPEMRHPDHALQYSPHRTPMPWNRDAEAGFTSGTPWLRLGTENLARNVETQQGDQRSMLTLYRRLIRLRRDEPALLAGQYHPVQPDGDVLVFCRQAAASRILVGLNFSDMPGRLQFEGVATVALSTFLDRDGERCSGSAELRRNEGLVLRFD